MHYNHYYNDDSFVQFIHRQIQYLMHGNSKRMLLIVFLNYRLHEDRENIIFKKEESKYKKITNFTLKSKNIYYK